MQPGTGELPVGFDGRPTGTEQFGRLVDGSAGEVSTHHHVEPTRMEMFQSTHCFIQTQEINRVEAACVWRGNHRGIERLGLVASAAFLHAGRASNREESFASPGPPRDRTHLDR